MAVREEVPPFESFPTWNNISGMHLEDGSLVTIVAYSMLMTFSVIGNITFFSITLKQRLIISSGINTLFAHLAIADLLLTFLVMPLEIFLAITIRWDAKDPICKIASFSRIFVFYLSIYILVCISIDRCYAEFKPMDPSGSNKRAKVMLKWVWLGSILLSALQLINSPEAQNEIYSSYLSYEQCTTVNAFMNDAYKVDYALSILLISFLSPIVVITLSYFFILCKMCCCSKNGINSLAKCRTLKLNITTVTIFVICWSPYYGVVFWYLLYPDLTKNVDIPLQKVLFFFACTNCSINPIVYGTFYMGTSSQAPIQILFRSTSTSSMDITEPSYLSSSSSSSSRSSQQRLHNSFA